MEFDTVIKNRRSVRRYLARPVEPELIRQCLAAAQLAPSACNSQPTRFIIVDDRNLIRRIQNKACHQPVANAWLATAPVVVILCAEKSFITNRVAEAVSGIPYHIIDASIAGEHFVLKAVERGLGTCWIGWFREEAVKRLLSIPAGLSVISLIALGYPDPAYQPPERKLKTISEIASWNRYGQGTL